MGSPDTGARERLRSGRTFQARCTCTWAGPVRPYEEHGKCDTEAGAHLATSRDPNCVAVIYAYDEGDNA